MVRGKISNICIYITTILQQCRSVSQILLGWSACGHFTTTRHYSPREYGFHRYHLLHRARLTITTVLIMDSNEHIFMQLHIGWAM
uniref:Uncharacterized protein n=1 Tax=Anguilla anguilla TaxID=7936 RepID=A0A0E9X7K4_ANGAN